MSQTVPPGAGRLLEMAALRAELERRREAKAPARPRPVVTISREYGALGASIGRRVAERLGFAFWDRELVNKIASSLSKPVGILESLDERHHSIVLDLLAALLNKEESAGEYRRELANVIRTLAQEGSAVIVGRGGQFVVRPKGALRVRVVAPVSDRIEGIEQREGLSQADAERRVREVDQQRATFVKDTFDGEIDSVGSYDLIVNSASFGLEGSASIIEHAYRRKFEVAEGRLEP